MKSPNRQYIPEVDELRGGAALLIFFYHSAHSGWLATGHSGWLMSGFPLWSILFEGHTAVGLLVVLSGFVLAAGALGREIQYGQFLRNRLLRILPLAALVCVFALYGSHDYNLAGALAPFLLLQNTPVTFSDLTQLTGILWYVSVAFQFYLVAPFLIAFTSRRGLRGFLLPAIALVFALKLIVLAANWDRPDELFRVSYSTIVGRLNQFLVGIGLAYLLPRLPAARRPAGLLLLGASCGLVAFTWALNLGGGVFAWHHWRVLHPEIEALLWAGVIGGYLAWRPSVGLRGGGALRRAGLWSFSLCVLHWPALQLFWAGYKRFVGHELNVRSIVAVSAVLLLPPVMCLAGLAFTCVERPFLELRARYLSRRPEHAPEALAAA